VRIRLPGGAAEKVVRTPMRSFPPYSSSQDVESSIPTGASSEDGDRVFVVRIPRRVDEKELESSLPAAPDVPPEESTTVTDLSLEDVFTVRPHAVPNHVPLQPPPPEATQHSEPPNPTAPLRARGPSVSQAPPKTASYLPTSEAQQQLEQLFATPLIEADTGRSAQIEETVLRNPPSASILAPVPQIHSPEEPKPLPPVLPPLQTNFSPVPQTSPPYGSPYAYGPPMPPGVAMSQHGYPYEVATGRPVYLQATPPPPMFTPRPLMHMGHPAGAVPFVPSHMHHHSLASASPDFLAPPHTPPVNGFVDPSTGVPIFTPARQSSRIEIRAPSDAAINGKGPSKGPSGLRKVAEAPQLESGTPSFPPGLPPPASQAPSMDVPPSEQPQPNYQVVDPSMMGYAPYQQQYYYPGQYGYPPPYMDPSQVMNYEMYPQSDQSNQPIIYY